MRVLKLSGHGLISTESMRATAQRIARMDGNLTIVHGGGSTIDDLQAKLGHSIKKHEGLRVTDDDALLATLMVLCGQLNKQLVAALINAGLDAFGFCGVDASFIKVRKLKSRSADLGFVGEVRSIRKDLIHGLLALGITPVIAPLTLGEDGFIYNVNADEIAAAISIALGAEELIMVSNVPGLIADGQVLSKLDVKEAQGLFESGEISGGMIPKVQAGLKVLRDGIPRVRIIDFKGLCSGGGTLIVAGNSSKKTFR